MATTVIGPVKISHNIAQRIISSQFSDIVFSKDIMFQENQCNNVIFLYSEPTYIKVTDHTNVTFMYNVHYDKTIDFELKMNNNPCSFQYVALQNWKNVSTKDYTINFITSDEQVCDLYFSSNCKWIPSSVFYGYKSAWNINQQIIRINDKKTSPIICYCSHNIL